MTARAERYLNSDLFPDSSPFKKSPRPQKLRTHSRVPPKQLKEGEQRALRRSGEDSSIQNRPVYAGATPQDVEERMQFQIRRYMELSNGGKLPSGWESFAANHRGAIAAARKNSA